jgi:hypothetical protein
MAQCGMRPLKKLNWQSRFYLVWFSRSRYNCPIILKENILEMNELLILSIAERKNAPHSYLSAHQKR